MQQGLFVTVSRKWNNPIIEEALDQYITDLPDNVPEVLPLVVTKIDADEIRLHMPLRNFMKLLLWEIDAQLPAFLDTIRQQIGSVTWVFTQATFDATFAKAVNATTEQGVLDKIFQDAVDKVVEGVKEESVKVV